MGGFSQWEHFHPSLNIIIKTRNNILEKKAHGVLNNKEKVMKVNKVGKVWGKILEKKSNAVDDAYARSARRAVKALIPIAGDIFLTTGELVVELGKACFALEQAEDLDKELRKAFPTHKDRKKAAKKAAKKAVKAAKKENERLLEIEKIEAEAASPVDEENEENGLIDQLAKGNEIIDQLMVENERLRRLLGEYE